MPARIDEYKDHFLLREEYTTAAVQRARGIPAARWSRPHGAWVTKPYFKNVTYMDATWPDAIWSEEASKLRHRILMERDAMSAEVDLSALDGVPFKLEPMYHQKVGLLMGRDKHAYAYFPEQGCGKSAIALDDAAHNYRNNKIDALIIVAPNGQKPNWVAWEGEDIITKHLAPDIPHHKFVFNSDANKAEQDLWAKTERAARMSRGMIIVAVNYEALIVKRCYDWLEDLCKKLRVMIVFDESTRIKKRGIRSRQAKKLRDLCVMARILTGTPVIKRPLDFYYQFETLDPAILGFGSYYSFRNHFSQMGGFQGKKILSYRNLDELTDLISPWSFRVTKEQALKDLPPKIYMPPLHVEMTAVQAQAYKEMKKEFATAHDGKEVQAPNVLAQMMRLQQITGGYLTQGEDTVIELVDPHKNPKFREAMEIIEDTEGQVIVWARFTHEIDAFCRVLEKAKVSYRRFDGSTPKAERPQIGKDFLDGKFKVIVANQQVGGTGQDWYTADTVIYISNSFNTEERVQSEDRAHRKGTKRAVNYYDIIVPGTEDVRVLRVIKGDMEVSEAVMSALEDWR